MSDLDPDRTCDWYQTAAEQSSVEAMVGVAALLAAFDPHDMGGARRW